MVSLAPSTTSFELRVGVKRAVFYQALEQQTGVSASGPNRKCHILLLTAANTAGADKQKALNPAIIHSSCCGPFPSISRFAIICARKIYHQFTDEKNIRRFNNNLGIPSVPISLVIEPECLSPIATVLRSRRLFFKGAHLEQAVQPILEMPTLTILPSLNWWISMAMILNERLLDRSQGDFAPFGSPSGCLASRVRLSETQGAQNQTR
jgi:hypothetical protein